MINKILSFPQVNFVIPVCFRRESTPKNFGFPPTIRGNDKTIIGNKKGYLLPMVIIYMIIAMIVGSGIMVLGSLERIETNKRLHREQAFYLAEAGINYALFQLKNSSSWVPSPSSYPLGNGNFLIDETINGDTAVITSTGTVDSEKPVSTQMTLVINKTGIFSSGIFASDFAEIKGDTKIYGNVGSNLRIKRDGNCFIYGNANVAPGGIIELNTTKGYVNLPLIYTASTRTLAPSNVPDELSAIPFTLYSDPKISGSAYTIDSNNKIKIDGDGKVVNFASGDYRFRDSEIVHNARLNILGDARVLITHAMKFDNGNLTINPGSTLLLYIGDEGLDLDGDIDAKNGSMLNVAGDPSALRVYAYGEKKKHAFENVTVKGLFYAPMRNEQMEIKGTTNFTGVIVTKKFKFDNHSVITYDTSLYHEAFPESPGPTTNTVTFASWTKPDWKR